MAAKAVEIVNPDGAGRVVLLCEHAAHHIPDQFQGLGLADGDRFSHAAWDPGARGVALALSRALDAPLIAGGVSRLIYDLNRPPEADSAMPARSERIEVPGNQGLDAADRMARTMAFYRPFCDAVDAMLAARPDAVLITIHSFTPVFHGRPRSVEIGILHDSDSRLADLILAEAARLPGRVLRRNDPYGPEDGVTHSLKLHAQSRGLANVMIELRNDLITTEDEEQAMAEDLLTLLRPALAALSIGEGR